MATPCDDYVENHIDRALLTKTLEYDPSTQTFLPAGVTLQSTPIYPTFGCVGLNSAEASQIAFNNSAICLIDEGSCNQQPNNTLPYPYSLGCGTQYNKVLSRYLLDLMVRTTLYFNGAPLALPPGLVQGPDLINIVDAVQGVIFATPNKKRIYLCFRGTSGVREWELNARAAQVKWPLAGVPDLACHYGFVENWQTMAPSLNLYLSNVPLDAQIVVTGHSSGGALAQLTAYSLAASLRPTWLYAYSGPKVCNLNLDGKLPFLKAFFRVFNTSDPIPTLPWSATPDCENPLIPYFYNSTGVDCTFQNNRLSIIQSHVLAPIIIAAENDEIFCSQPVNERGQGVYLAMFIFVLVFFILIACIPLSKRKK